MPTKAFRPYLLHWTSISSHKTVCAGDVKEFGFREIPDDDNFHSSFSADVPTADAAEEQSQPESVQSNAGPSASESTTQDEAKESSWFSGTSKKAASWMPWSKKEEVVGLFLS